MEENRIKGLTAHKKICTWLSEYFSTDIVLNSPFKVAITMYLHCTVIASDPYHYKGVPLSYRVQNCVG